ncbi:MFS transporter [Pseudovibrio sp. Ad37]|uniref:MFS transporter n=1 Tax=Pseudovibrio sp. Ad37 TaxID=989422 RepID=UPI0007AE9404|nr:MFS transporter [Pseudovibrio sp. Ad37]KZL26979.1 putative MFS-type transporter YcaD [Pseudovibrio sp. Ad37]
MRQFLLPIASLLLGSAFLFFAGGVTGMHLPLRGTFEGFSSLSLGLLGTGWAIGYVTGCLSVPKIVQRAGHIRAFGVMASLACLSVLASSLLVDPIAWIAFRSVAGFAFAGAAMIVESWLTERSDPSNRGVVFGTYTMVNLAATTGGQVVLSMGPIDGFEFFVIASMFYVVALIPTAVTRTPAPAPLAQVKLDIRRLWRNSPVAVVAVVLTGVSNGSFGTLAAVYGGKVGLPIASITLFVSSSILAGAFAQVPIGMISDRTDRRYVVIAIAVVALAADSMFLFADTSSANIAIASAVIFGAAIYTFYPVLVAHANDHADAGDAMQTSGGLLLMLGVGSMIGPFLGGVLMSVFGSIGLFMSTFAAHALILAFTLWRLTQRSAVAESEKSVFVPSAPTRTATPQTIILADEEVAKEMEVDELSEQPSS